jgi:predicted 3-demethylubiquinone-9 3-methyltransferase (glyoxalase superfamily)
VSIKRISPFLWFNDQAEEAMRLYTSLFPNSRIVNIQCYENGGPNRDMKVLTATFELDGNEFIALNGGPTYTFTPAISFLVECETQAEVDRYYDTLAEGGEAWPCGWVKDKFGIAWQIVPAMLFAALNHPDKAKAGAAMNMMLTMKKIDIAAIETALT